MSSVSWEEGYLKSLAIVMNVGFLGCVGGTLFVVGVSAM